MREKLSTLERIFIVPITRNSVLSLFSFRKIEVSQDFMSDKQEIREEGGSVELGLQER